MESVKHELRNILEDCEIPYVIDDNYTEGFVIYAEEHEDSVTSAAVRDGNYQMNFSKFDGHPDESLLYRCIDALEELSELVPEKNQ